VTTNKHVISSEWAPLQIAAFRAIWFASLAANVGTWFQNVGRVAHDEVYCVSSLDRAHADGDDVARISRRLARWSARRYREPPPPVARHPEPDSGHSRHVERPNLRRAHERTTVAGLHLYARPGRNPGKSGLASSQRGTRSSR
jgi:hypothetical protein